MASERYVIAPDGQERVIDVIDLTPEPGARPTVEHHAASMESVAYVLAQPVDGPDEHDGRSEWRWFRLSNGDLILGVFPHGDTYFATERDHS